MKYVNLGATGIKVSEIGMGCEGLIGKTPEETEAFIKVMLENGVNCIDLYTSNPDVRMNLAKAIKNCREKFIRKKVSF